MFFPNNNHRSSHEFMVHNINVQICSLCGKKCKGMYGLEKHMKSYSLKEISCKHCAKKFKIQYQLERHDRRMHGADSEKPFPCSYQDCRRAFTTKQALESHMNCHLGLKPYQCHICQTSFQNSSNKAAHMRNVHKFSKSSKNY